MSEYHVAYHSILQDLLCLFVYVSVEDARFSHAQEFSSDGILWRFSLRTEKMANFHDFFISFSISAPSIAKHNRSN
jgi:hypothetical protein